MLEMLRKMSPSAKKRLVASCAGLITVIIFGSWIAYTSSIFSSAYQSTSEQGVALFSFVEQNVDKAYDAFATNVPKFFATSTATSTEDGSIATTTVASTTATTTIN